MFAQDPNSLQEAEIAEVEPFAEAMYDGYAEADPFAGYGEYYPPPSYGIQMPQITPPGLTRQIWSAAENRYVTYRWDMFQRRWVRSYPSYGGSPGGIPPGWMQGGSAAPRRVYMRCSVWPGPPGLSPAAAGQPGYPGQPGFPGQPGYPMQQPYPGGGGGRRHRRRRR